MALSGRELLLKSVVWTTLIVGGGYACMKLLTPTSEEILKEIPASERQRIEQRMNKENERNAALFEVMKKNLESDQPVWKVYHKDKFSKLDEKPSG